MMSFFFAIFLIVSCASEKEKTYAGSTPADAIIRSFLGIPMSDSIDFIRWELSLQDNRYHLQCNYGIGKPNTDGFINGGAKIELSGDCRKEENIYYLQNGDRTFMILELNDDLLHFLNEDKTLLAGNGGWSYTLNSVNPEKAEQLNIHQNPIVLNDSVVFHGRTPCAELVTIPGLHLAADCYRLKWSVVLYSDAKTKMPTTYLMKGTAFERQGTKTGSWHIVSKKHGKNIFALDLGENNGAVYFIRPDENILLFTDEQGNLLVGNKDFSYTLSKNKP